MRTPRPRSLTLTLILLASASCLSASLNPVASQVVGDSTRVVTAALLKRLGEVVDGHRSGGTIYVVMSYRLPYDVAAVVSTLDSAQVAAHRAGAVYGAFGPYTSQSEAPQGQLFAVLHCPKDAITSLFVCPDSSVAQVHAVLMRDVVQVEVSVRTRDGQVHTQSFTPDHVEALFFTLSAIDKFAVPYYERVLGLQYATDFRAQMQRWFLSH